MRILVERAEDGFGAGLSGSIREWGGSGRAWAVVSGVNLLADGAELPRVPPGVERLVVPPGFLPGDEDDGPAEMDPRTWGPRAWEKLEAAVRRLGASGGPRLLLRPGAGQVVSDVPSTQRLLEQVGEWGEGVGVLLDPVAMLVGSMLERAEDHVARALSQLAGRGGVAGVVVSNAGPRDGGVMRTEVGRGVVPPGSLAALVREHVPAELPIVLLGEEIDRQAALLAQA